MVQEEQCVRIDAEGLACEGNTRENGRAKFAPHLFRMGRARLVNKIDGQRLVVSEITDTERLGVACDTRPRLQLKRPRRRARGAAKLARHEIQGLPCAVCCFAGKPKAQLEV